MGSTFEILFPSEQRSRIEATHRALDEIRRLENIMTVFREESSLSLVNREAAKVPVGVEEELFEILQLSREISDLTGGAFDITSGVLSRCWGFRERKGSMPSEDAIEECLSKMGWRFLDLDLEKRTVEFGLPGLELNLGSIGKGFALDRAGVMLQNAGFEKTLLNAGHSSVLALGDAVYPGGGWKVAVRHPVDRDMNLFNVSLRNQALGTSGSGEQFFEQDGKLFGHIIDPRSGRPADRYLSATSVAPTAAVADAMATAFFVMSPDAIKALCRDNEEIGAIVVPRSPQGEAGNPLAFGIACDCVDTREISGGEH